MHAHECARIAHALVSPVKKLAIVSVIFVVFSPTSYSSRFLVRRSRIRGDAGRGCSSRARLPEGGCYRRRAEGSRRGDRIR